MIWTDERILARVAFGAKVGMGLAFVLAAVSVVLVSVNGKLGSWWWFLAGAIVMLVAASFAVGYGIAHLKYKHSEWRIAMHEHVRWLLDLLHDQPREGTRDDVILREFFARDDAYSDLWYAQAKVLAAELKEAA